MIVSFRDGRVRLRSPALRSETALEEVGRMLAAYAGVKKIETNAYTGSLLVLYDPAMISTEQLNLAAAMLESRFILPAAGPGRAGVQKPYVTQDRKSPVVRQRGHDPGRRCERNEAAAHNRRRAAHSVRGQASAFASQSLLNRIFYAGSPRLPTH